MVRLLQYKYMWPWLGYYSSLIQNKRETKHSRKADKSTLDGHLLKSQLPAVSLETFTATALVGKGDKKNQGEKKKKKTVLVCHKKKKKKEENWPNDQ